MKMTDDAERHADAEMECHHVNDDPRDMTDATYLRWMSYHWRNKEERARMQVIADRLDAMRWRKEPQRGDWWLRWTVPTGEFEAQFYWTDDSAADAAGPDYWFLKFELPEVLGGMAPTGERG